MYIDFFFLNFSIFEEKVLLGIIISDFGSRILMSSQDILK